MASTNARRSAATKKVTRPARRVVAQKPAPEPEPVEVEEEDFETEVDETEDEATQEVEDVNEDEVPESIKQLAEDAMAAAEDDDLDSMPVLTIEMIREAKDRTTEWVPVKEWGGKMQVRSLSAEAMFEMLGDDSSGITESGFKMDLSVKSMQKQIIQNGVSQPVITDEAFVVLMQKSTAPVMRLLNAIMRVSKLGGGDSDAKPVDEEIKTFRPSGEQ